MNRRAFLASIVSAAAAARAQSRAESDVVLRAMEDELERSRALRIVGLDKPYFFSYTLYDGENYSASASLGAIVRSSRTRYRLPRIEVRVGDYAFDNTNYVGMLASGSRYDTASFPIDDSYDALRRHLWLATDSAYKSAVEAISRKRAALKNVAAQDSLRDFAPAQPLRMVLPVARVPLDEDAWLKRLRRLSAVFAEFPELALSSVAVQSGWSAHYIATSEGTRVRVPESMTAVEMRARAYAPDGEVVRDADVAHALDPRRLPPEAELERRASEVGKNVTALAAAPLAEPYTGPVLFEGTAAPQIFAELLGRNLTVRRRPVSNPGRPLSFAPGELEGRLGAPVLPEWMDAVDDPTQTEWQGEPLFGHYRVDLEGVAPEPLTLVEKGVLKTFLLTRQPVMEFAQSNGRARLPGGFGHCQAACGNLFVRATKSVSEAELRAQLLDMCRRRNKPYGIIIRKMDFPSSASLNELRSAFSSSGGGRPVSLPLLVYRVYADGREELVRGLRFRGLGARSLRDIVAASDRNHLFHFLENGAPFALMGAASFVAETSVVAPSVLIDDVELERVPAEHPRPPLVPPPALT